MRIKNLSVALLAITVILTMNIASGCFRCCMPPLGLYDLRMPGMGEYLPAGYRRLGKKDSSVPGMRHMRTCLEIQYYILK